jgi:hypothetical protein
MSDEHPADLAQIAADDALLDALGKGEAPPPGPQPAGDELAGLLHAWRADLDDKLDATQPLVGELLEAQSNRPIELKPKRRGSKLLTGVAAAILILGGLAAGASQAGPNSPLWPLTKVMYPERADTRSAEQAISRARAAIAANRLDEANHQLDQATALVGRLQDSGDKRRLTDQIAQLRQLIAAKTAPSQPATPSAPVPGATPAAPQGPTAQPAPQPTRDPGDNPLPLPTGGLPTLPDLPAPTLPAPTLPQLPLPSLPIPIPPIQPS